jgi:hypothetical protein
MARCADQSPAVDEIKSRGDGDQVPATQDGMQQLSRVCGDEAVTDRTEDPVMNNDILYIEPITFGWATEWLPRIRSCYPRMKTALDDGGPVAAAKAIGDWQHETDVWLRTFDAQKRRSVIDLLFAECEMLFETLDPSDGSKPIHGGLSWSDFRERWFNAIPLALATQRCAFEKADLAVGALRTLETHAAQKNWLP